MPIDEFKQLAAVIFAGSPKGSVEEFDEDSPAFGSVIRNRKGEDGSYFDVISSGQFYEFGSPEYQKFMSGNLTEDEEIYAKKAMQMARGIMSGAIEDPTGGADHIYNPELDNPNEWNVLWDEKDVKVNDTYYPETYRTKKHVYRKATQRWSKRRKNIAEDQKSLQSAGFYDSNIDGIAGPIMKEGTRAYQKSVGLKPDGIFGKNTRSSLNKPLE